MQRGGKHPQDEEEPVPLSGREVVDAAKAGVFRGFPGKPEEIGRRHPATLGEYLNLSHGVPLSGKCPVLRNSYITQRC